METLPKYIHTRNIIYNKFSAVVELAKSLVELLDCACNWKVVNPQHASSFDRANPHVAPSFDRRNPCDGLFTYIQMYTCLNGLDVECDCDSHHLEDITQIIATIACNVNSSL